MTDITKLPLEEQIFIYLDDEMDRQADIIRRKFKLKSKIEAIHLMNKVIRQKYCLYRSEWDK